MDILLTIAPPFWEYLPPLGLAFLKSNLSPTITSEIFDFNIFVYNKLKKKDNLKKIYNGVWAGNKKNNSALFDKIISNYPDVLMFLNNRIVKKKIKIIGFSLFRSNLDFTLHLIKYIKTQFPKIKIIVGGPEVFEHFVLKSNSINQTFFRLVDCFIAGDGEEVLNFVVHQILAQVQIDKVVYSKNTKRLDDLDVPNFSDFDLSLYKRTNVLPVQTSRGCINNCAFCSEKFLSPYYRSLSPKKIVENLVLYQKKYKISNFIFYDSLINGNLKNLEQFCELVIEKKIDIHWEGQFLIRSGITEKLIKKMKQAGCYNLFIGLESGSDRILKYIHKKFNTEMAIQVFQILNKVGLHFEVSLIVDFPFERKKDFLATLQFLKKNKYVIPKIAQINEWKAYPGTAIKKPFWKTKSTRVEQLIQFLKEEQIKFSPVYVRNLYL